MSLPREGSRVIREGVVISVPHDWCKSPDCIVPYRIHTHSKGQTDGADAADSVRQTDVASHVKGSKILQCYGDEPGTGGGVISGTHNAECEPKTWSETVRFEDRNAVRHDDEWWMNHKNTWGKLVYLKDTKNYDTPEDKDVKPRMQFAQADAATMTDAAPAGAGGMSIPKPGVGAGVVAGGIAMQQLDQLRENSAVQSAGQQFDLDLSQPNNVLAARAYVWGKNMAPMSYGDVPFSGPTNEAVARSIMNTEMAHPGTVGGAMGGNPDDRKRLDAAVKAALAAAAAGQVLRISRGRCYRDVVVSRRKSPLAAQHIDDAQAAGKPSTLTLDRPGTYLRRAANMKAFGKPAITGMDRDEYPPATFPEAVGSSVRYVPLGDNRSAGQQIGEQMNSPTRATEGCKVTIKTGP